MATGRNFTPLISDNDPMLLLDRRFLMDFLTESAPTEHDARSRAAILDPPAREDLLAHAETIGRTSHRVRRIFLKASQSFVLALSANEFDRWALMGISLLQQVPQTPMMAGYFFQSGPAVLAAGSFLPFKGWLETGEMIGRHSSRAASEFFRLTPLFLNHCDFLHLQKWGELGIRILSQVRAPGERPEQLAVSFFQNSIDSLPYMPFREIREWQSVGISFAAHQPELARIYFSEIPGAWKNLNWEERNRMYRVTSALIKTDAKSALRFFMEAPKNLRDVGPHVRDLVLDVSEKLSQYEPKKMTVELSRLVLAVGGLPNPTQETVLRQGERLAEESITAARMFFDHIRPLLGQLREAFLGLYVDHGLRLMASYPDQATAYFSLSGNEARDILLKWKHAVLLDDHRHVLAMFAEAMTGKTMTIREYAPDSVNRRPIAVTGLPANRSTVFLPSFVAGGKSAAENFSVLKVATAHQAGYLEFGAPENGLDMILEILGTFSLKDLALDIFFILEDGRIDRLLKQYYRGLEKDMEAAVSHALTLRRRPEGLSFREALVEILLRLSVGRWNTEDEAILPGFFLEYVEFLKQSLSGFYRNGVTVWDCFSKTIDIYRYLLLFPDSRPESPDDAIYGKDLKSDAHPYLGMPRPCFRKETETPGGKDPIELQVEAIEETDACGGVPLSLDELQQLIGQIENPLALLKAIEGKTLAAPGIFIQSRDQLVLKTPDPEGDADDKPLSRPGPPQNSGCTHLNGPFYYDEWDYEHKVYRKNWCRLVEKIIEGDCADRIDEIYATHKGLIDQVKKQFQQIRPDIHEILPRVEWGDEIDLTAAIQVVVDKKSAIQPSDRIFTRKEKKTRKIAVVFLVDMSASTGNPASGGPSSLCDDRPDGIRGQELSRKDKKIIDIETESLVVIAEALEALNDEYAIFGFSGYGRDNVDFYRIKEFDDSYSKQVKMRIGSILPRQSTRMGPAIRHAARKLASMETQQRLLILLSDGFPQDCDYGEDRTSHEYGLHDTMMALLEAKNEGISPFCITVDQSGNDYLKKMCNPKNYLVIQDIFSLPEVLPKVVESLLE